MKALTGDGAESTSGPPRPARRSPTIYEVAERAGVSIATVSRVQRNATLVAAATRDRVAQAITDLEYRPSSLGRRLARGSHEATGIVFPDLSGPYYSAVILGYEEASAVEGRSVLILGTHRRPGAVDQVFDLADRVDGLVIMGRTVDDAVVEELGRRRVPVVLLARAAVADSDSVRADNGTAARALVSHLIGHGHRSIVFVGDPEASADAAERWDGYLAAHAAAGLRAAHEPVRCAFREADGREAGRAILALKHRPAALMGASDEIAMGLLEAARHAGLRTPEDVAITGWDDIPAARHLSPPLTTVRQPMQEIGRRAAALLHERIGGSPRRPRHDVLPTELVVRASCGCAAPQPEGGVSR